MKLSLKKQINVEFPKVGIRDNLPHHLASLFIHSNLEAPLQYLERPSTRQPQRCLPAPGCYEFPKIFIPPPSPTHTHQQLTPSTATISPRTSWDSKKGAPFNIKESRQLPFPNRKRA